MPGTSVTPADPETLAWLLEPENTSVRWCTLRSLLGRGPEDAETARARAAIMETGPVPAILEHQTADGGWGEPGRFYLDKYTGAVWQLLILAELGADGADPRLGAAAEFLLRHSQEAGSGGFAVNQSGSAKTGAGADLEAPGGRKSEVIPCLTGNLAFSLIRLGWQDDLRVRRAIDWICSYQRCDDGDGAPPAEWPYDRYEMCWGRHSCHMGVVKGLKALAAIAPQQRSQPVKDKIAQLAEYLLIHHIHKKSHDLSATAKPGWLKPGFPLMYQTDILEILLILSSLGIRDPRMAEAVEIIRGKRGANGRWKLENSFNGKMRVDIEAKGQESKWITLRALQVLAAWDAPPLT